MGFRFWGMRGAIVSMGQSSLRMASFLLFCWCHYWNKTKKYQWVWNDIMSKHIELTSCSHFQSTIRNPRNREQNEPSTIKLVRKMVRISFSLCFKISIVWSIIRALTLSSPPHEIDSNRVVQLTMRILNRTKIEYKKG